MLTKHLELLYVVFSVECTPAGRRHIDYRVDTFKAYTHALHRPSYSHNLSAGELSKPTRIALSVYKMVVFCFFFLSS